MIRELIVLFSISGLATTEIFNKLKNIEQSNQKLKLVQNPSSINQPIIKPNKEINYTRLTKEELEKKYKDFLKSKL